MKTVGIRNLKNSLSMYINMVKEGERIFITDHNKIVAEIIPTSGIESESKILKEYINDQSENGLLIKATKRTKIRRKIKKVKKEKDIIKKIYKETRNDRP